MSAHAKLLYLSAALALGALYWGRASLPWTASISVIILLLFYRKRVLIICKTFPRDVRSIILVRKMYKFLSECQQKDETIIDLFRRRVEKHPRKIIFYFEDTTWTYSEVEAFSNRIANVFREAGHQKNDVVTLLMGNCPEYVAIWLGIAKIGGVTALINTSLRNQTLLHCLNAAKAKAVIYSEEFETAISEISGQIGHLKKYRWGKDGELNALMEAASEEVPPEGVKVGYRDRALYVYTSGTTGLPKPAIIPHYRLLMFSVATACVIGVGEKDIVYNSLPLYHVAGGLLGIAGALSHGFASAIKKKFSASAYWPDCIKYNCTVAQYIGEMCRYVMQVPSRPEDTRHKVRIIFGNGMRSSLWPEFKRRFNIDRISEIYGSTEGNTNLVNIDKTVGAVGFLPTILPSSMLPMALIKVDDSGEPVRNSEGFCIRCAPNEQGVFVGMIVDSDPTREFSGYVGDRKESENKIIENVFKKGDKAFLSGDILYMDEYNYIYFKDRIGDTYRWKGENVSTAEVEGVISSAVGLLDVLVFGVQVGNLEGKAGMAVIVDPDAKVDLTALTAEIDRNLPPYARPLFLRFSKRVDVTGTFKTKKLNFQTQAFDPEEITEDKLYFRQGGRYVELTKQIYDDVISGAIRV